MFKVCVLPGYLQNKYSSFNYIMQINPKFLVNINSYIDFITMYVLLKNIVFW